MNDIRFRKAYGMGGADRENIIINVLNGYTDLCLLE
jgi:hypothetical protein